MATEDLQRPGIQSARAALDAYTAELGTDDGGDLDTALIDLIADLLHLADALGISGQCIADRATDYYADEEHSSAGNDGLNPSDS